MSRALAFLGDEASLSYGARLQRLRWRRFAGVATAADWSVSRPAADALAGASEWLVVLDPTAIPSPTGTAPAAAAGRVLAVAAPVDPRVHTLRELEAAAVVPAAGPPASTAALLFRAADFPPEFGEPAGAFVARLSRRAEGAGPRFWAVPFDAPSERERPELTRRIPAAARRILDVGCGAGGAIASARDRHSGWTITGIEADPALAARARARCDRVLEGDLRRVLPELSRAGERFDAIVFGDVLEHLEGPVAALALARSVAAGGASLLVSVPNVGHLSIVRDLVSGRFDPIPAGLTDAGHLRWFTRAFLAEAIAEAGWCLASIEGEPGAPAPDAAGFLGATEGWPERDAESLATYQWIATASA